VDLKLNKLHQFVYLGINGTFSTNRLYRAITAGKYVTLGQETTDT